MWQYIKDDSKCVKQIGGALIISEMFNIIDLKKGYKNIENVERTITVISKKVYAPWKCHH